MSTLFRTILIGIVIGGLGSLRGGAQTTTVIPANEVAAHVGEHAIVEGVVAKVFTSKAGNTLSQYRRCLPQPDIYRLDPASFAGLEINDSFRHRRKARQNYSPNRDVQRKAGDSNQCRLTA
jgi:hypothetical protein